MGPQRGDQGDPIRFRSPFLLDMKLLVVLFGAPPCEVEVVEGKMQRKIKKKNKQEFGGNETENWAVGRGTGQ